MVFGKAVEFWTAKISGERIWHDKTCGPRRGYTVTQLLRLRVPIPPAASASASLECCALSCRGFCFILNTYGKESYRMWCVVVCDLETSGMKRTWPNLGFRGKYKQNDLSVKSNTHSFPITRWYELFSKPVKRQWRPINNIMWCVCDCRRQGSVTLYRAFHNVVRDYKHIQQENQMNYFIGNVQRHRKTEVLFITTRDVPCVHHGWHGTHWYDIQVLATKASTWVHRYSSLLQWSVPFELFLQSLNFS